METIFGTLLILGVILAVLAIIFSLSRFLILKFLKLEEISNDIKRVREYCQKNESQIASIKRTVENSEKQIDDIKYDLMSMR